jgi:uncharacterized protein (UPF0261 family)
MKRRPRILIVGTADTKADEILFITDCITQNGAEPMVMDVSVLGSPSFAVKYSKHEVATASGATIPKIIALGDENEAMKKMAEGAAALACHLYQDGAIDALLALGGTMGTDLALDVAAALPLGVPKFIISTVAYSHLIPPERLAPDLMMILWAGGLYGLNSICRSVLSQAAGAICGAAASCQAPQRGKPVIGVSSLGKSCLSYMVRLVPALEDRGYEVAVFHATGMGGRAFESLAARGAFAAVLDLALCELSNAVFGGDAGAGPDRLEGAGRAGTPQIVAPGAMDMIDFAAWRNIPECFKVRGYHAHNRLIASIGLNAAERSKTACILAAKLSKAQGPVTVICPLGGIEEWDRKDGPMHDPDAHAAFATTLRNEIKAPIRLVEIASHINDSAFTEAVLQIFDAWVDAGIVPVGVRPVQH